MQNRSLLALAAASLLAASPALAQVSASAATDLNLRSGPGPEQEILATIPANGEVTVEGCLEAANWCRVTYEGTSGWAYGDYLTAIVEEQPLVVIENREPLQVGTVTYETDADEAAAGAGAVAGGALALALVGGPAALAAGAIIGAASGAAVAPDDVAVTYIRENPVDPVYLDGEVIVGAGIPEGVEVVAVPDTSYGYLNVNGQPVLVDTANRQIVYIDR